MLNTILIFEVSTNKGYIKLATMLHFPASSLNFPKLSAKEKHNYNVMRKINPVRDNLNRNKNLMQCLNNKANDRDLMLEYTEDQMRSFLMFKADVLFDLKLCEKHLEELRKGLLK